MTTTSDPRAKSVPALWRGPIVSWGRSLVAAGLARSTLATRLDHARRTARAFGGAPGDVTAAALIDWAGQQTWRAETRRSMYASLRQFFGWCVTAGLVQESPAARLPRVRAADPRPRPAPDGVVRAAMARADDRGRLIVRLGAELGLRRAEIAQVHAGDLVEDLLGWSLLVHGKGGRDRLVPLTDEQAALIRGACGNGWMLPGRIDGHLSARRVGELAAEVLRGGWTAHSLRHRAATRVHESTGDLLAVQAMLGHRSVATTQRYVATSGDRLRRAVATAVVAAA